MEVKTKFEINNLVQHKFQKNAKHQIGALEVMEVLTQTCYGGTQVFYLCRAIFCLKEFTHSFKQEGEFTWTVAHGLHREDFSLGYTKYREDELVELSQESIDIILGNS